MPQEHPILEGDHASRWMGIEVDRADYGHAEIRMTLREEMLNGFGIAHGGMIFALADTCFALACNDPAGDGSTITVASGVDINFISSARRGEVLTAVGTVRAQAGRSGVYDIQVMAGGRLVAEFRGRSRTIPNPDRRETGRSAPSSGREPVPPAADRPEQEPVLQSAQPSPSEEVRP
jgi:acyl-CoA thioesterase